MNATTNVSKPSCWESFKQNTAPCKEWAIKITKIACAVLLAFASGWLVYTLLNPVGWSVLLVPMAALIVGQLACDYLGLRSEAAKPIAPPAPPVVLPPGAPRGMVNGTWTHCWMNALMQMIIATPATREALLASQTDGLKPFGDFIRGYERALKEGLSVVPQEYADSKALEAHFTKLIASSGIFAGRQNDLPEAWAAIHALLSDDFKRPMMQITQFVAPRSKNWPELVHRNHEEKIAPTCHLQVPLIPGKPFDKLMDAHFNVQEDMGHYLDMRNIRYYNQSAVLRFAEAPPLLWIELKRYNFIGGKTQKVSDDVVIPETYQLPLYRDPPAPYQIAACAIHKGATDNGGHYTAFVKGRDGKWYEVSDTNVRQVEQAEFEKARQQAYLIQYARV